MTGDKYEWNGEPIMMKFHTPENFGIADGDAGFIIKKKKFLLD